MNAAQKAIAKKSQDQRMAQSLVANPRLDPNADGRAVVRHMVARVDETAVEMERKWGRGTLPGLAGEMLASKFDAQMAKFHAAIEAGVSADVERHGEAMIRAWAAVEKEALSRGKKPREVVAFSAELQCGGKLFVVESQEDTAKVFERGAVVMTVQEVADLLSRDELGRIVVGVKKVFDAEVIKPPPDFTTGDEIPF